MRDLIAGERYYVLVTDLFDQNIRQHIAIWLWGKDLSGFWIQSGNEIVRLLDLVDRQAEASGNVRIPFTAKVVEVLVDNLVFNALGFPDSSELNEQAIFQISSSDPDWMERLHEVEGFLQIFDRRAG